MATIRLVPSTIYNAASSYLTITNQANAYTDTDSTTYATIQNTNASTSSRYIYIRGFNFDDIPSAAVVTDFSVKIKGYYTSGYSQNLYLANGTSTISNATATSFTTSVATREFNTSSLTWETIKGYGDNFGIRINCRRSSRNTVAYYYIYGAEIEVTYTVPDPRTITSTLTGDGTISPSGAQTYYDGDEYELTITPTNKSDTVTATQDGVDITSQLVAHGAGSTVTVTPDDVTTTSIQSGASYAEYAIGCSAESPSSSGTSSNMYASSGNTGYASYTFDFSEIPSDATIEEVEVRCYGHRENATIDSTHVSNVAVYVGSTNKADEDFPTTSNSIVTLNPTLTRSELDSVTVRHTVGYYGGLVLGISFDVTYSTGSGIDHYTYTYTVSGDSTIAVVIGGSGAQPELYVKMNGSWVKVTSAYKKVNGSWVLQSDLTTVFNSANKYRKGN